MLLYIFLLFCLSNMDIRKFKPPNRKWIRIFFVPKLTTSIVFSFIWNLALLFLVKYLNLFINIVKCPKPAKTKYENRLKFSSLHFKICVCVIATVGDLLSNAPDMVFFEIFGLRTNTMIKFGKPPHE